MSTLKLSGTCYQFKNAPGVILLVPADNKQKLTFQTSSITSTVPTWFASKKIVATRVLIDFTAKADNVLTTKFASPIYVQATFTEADVKQLYCRKTLDKSSPCTDAEIKSTYDQKCANDPTACMNRLRLILYDDPSHKYSVLPTPTVDRNAKTITAEIKTLISDKDPVCMGFE